MSNASPVDRSSQTSGAGAGCAKSPVIASHLAGLEACARRAGLLPIADWPLIGGASDISQQVKVQWLKKGVETIAQPSPLGPPKIDALHRALAGVLKPA